MDALSSGVSEFLRELVNTRGRFWPVLGRVAALGGGGAAFWDFLGGASGGGHSTSWVRSSRDKGTHS